VATKVQSFDFTQDSTTAGFINLVFYFHFKASVIRFI
jgi:hypothetical protein